VGVIVVDNCLDAGELCDGLGALRHGVLGQLPGEHQAHSSLDLAGRDGGLLIVARQAGRLPGDLVEDVIDERVQDGHGLGGDARVRVHLLQHPGGWGAGASKAICKQRWPRNSRSGAHSQPNASPCKC